MDPALVHELVAARWVQDPLDELSPREREVLALMAEGRSNAGIADDHRRVLAVLAFLETRCRTSARLSHCPACQAAVMGSRTSCF